MQQFRQEGKSINNHKNRKGHIHLVRPISHLTDPRVTASLHSIPEVALITTSDQPPSPGTTGEAKKASLEELLHLSQRAQI